MRAIVYRKYGSPDVLTCEDVEMPVAADDEVLIRVRAASVNPYDWHFMRGKPYPLRFLAGLRTPKVARLGVDVAGEVAAVGRNVAEFRVGDEVFGACARPKWVLCHGAFAEYACAPQAALVAKPENVTFEHAASIPIAGLTALQALRDEGKVQSGHRVLVNGAAGGVGTFAVQIAKTFDADVTGVCSTRNVEMVRSIGADRVVDYTQEDFTKMGLSFDVFIDAVGNRSLQECRRTLRPNGICVMAGGATDNWMIGPLTRALGAAALSRTGSRKLVGFLAKWSKEDMKTLAELIGAGKVKPVIDRSYGLSETPDAIRYVEAGHARGKVVIRVA